MKESKFWRNLIQVFNFENTDELQKQINEFNKKRFVIATQIFPLFKEGYKWVAIVYFKIKPESK